MPSQMSLCTSTLSPTRKGNGRCFFASREIGKTKIYTLSPEGKNRLQLSHYHGRSSERLNAQWRARSGTSGWRFRRRTSASSRWHVVGTTGQCGMQRRPSGMARHSAVSSGRTGARTALRTSHSGKRGAARRDVQR
jgi:hypothetical protein